MLLYNKKDTYTVLIGMALYHLLTIGLCVFFAYRFIILSYNPGGYLVIAMLLSMIIVVDVLLWRIQGYSRFLVRCKFDQNGIHCNILHLKKWSILWKDICIYGLCGYTSPGLYGIVFFSSNKNEIYSKESCTIISRQRIVFQTDEKRWSQISEYMPEKMQKELWYSIQRKRDCYYRIKSN